MTVGDPPPPPPRGDPPDPLPFPRTLPSSSPQSRSDTLSRFMTSGVLTLGPPSGAPAPRVSNSSSSVGKLLLASTRASWSTISSSPRSSSVAATMAATTGSQTFLRPRARSAPRAAHPWI